MVKICRRASLAEAFAPEDLQRCGGALRASETSFSPLAPKVSNLNALHFPQRQTADDSALTLGLPLVLSRFALEDAVLPRNGPK